MKYFFDEGQLGIKFGLWHFLLAFLGSLFEILDVRSPLLVEREHFLFIFFSPFFHFPRIVSEPFLPFFLLLLFLLLEGYEQLQIIQFFSPFIQLFLCWLFGHLWLLSFGDLQNTVFKFFLWDFLDWNNFFFPLLNFSLSSKNVLVQAFVEVKFPLN